MKKTLLLVLVLVLTLTFAFSLTACNDDSEEDQKVITYLGDSICEALIGAAPVSERDNYGYYALVGKMNNFKYYNHSVSGHQTSDGMLKDGYGLLELISNDYEDAVLIQSHIKEADMIHISILGNNALQFDMGWLMLEAADPDFEEKFAAGTTLLNYMVNGYEEGESIQTRTSLATGLEVEFNFPNTYQNIIDIVAKLKELNPNAKIIFQKVYNPVFEGTTLLSDAYWDEIEKITDDGRFGAKGTKITTWAQKRAVAQQILTVLNGVLDTYVENYPGQIEILDINSYFNEIAGDDVTTNSAGAQLMYADWTHPSNKGHAAIAAYTQKWVETLGFASPNALANYKAIKLEQINRMYDGLDGFDTTAATAAINAANSIEDVSAAYFAATDAFTPNYSRANLSYNRDGETYYSENTKFSIDLTKLQAAGVNNVILQAIGNLAFDLDTDSTYAEFKTDGTMHLQLQTKADLLKDLDELLDKVAPIAGFEDGDELLGSLGTIDLTLAIKQYVAQLFPGFTVANLEASLNSIKDSVGICITGLDYEDTTIQSLISGIATTGQLDINNLLSQLPKDLVLTLTMDLDYRIKTVKSVSGEEFTAIYLGKEVAVNPDTQPIGIFTQTTTEDGKKYLALTIDFIGLYLPLVEI